MAAASGASPAPPPAAPDRDWVGTTPTHAAQSFAVGDVVLAYHGSLLYEAVIKKVHLREGRLYSYVVNYQGWKKTWDAEVSYDAVFEHNDDNLRVAHRLLQGAKQRQQAIRPVDERHFSPIDSEYIRFVVPARFPSPSPEERPAAVAVVSKPSQLADTALHTPKPHDVTMDAVVSPRAAVQHHAAQHTPNSAVKTASAAHRPITKHSPTVAPSPRHHYSPVVERAAPVRRPPSGQYPGMVPTAVMTAHMPTSRNTRAPQANGHSGGAVDSDHALQGADVNMADPVNSPANMADRISPAPASPADTAEDARHRASRPDAALGRMPLEGESLFYLPHMLKQQLVDDWELVTKENRLVPLPRNVTVAEIVDSWARSHAPPEDIACREVAEGIKAYFDAALPTTLLYKFERLQFNEFYFGPNSMARSDAYPVRHYGAEHLLRLLLKLPYMLDSTGVDLDMMRRIAEKVNDLARFLVENGRVFFLIQYERASDDYISKVEKGDIEPAPMEPEQADDSPRSIDAPSSHPSPLNTPLGAPPPAHSIARSPAQHTPVRSPGAPTPPSLRSPHASLPHRASASPARSLPRS